MIGKVKYDGFKNGVLLEAKGPGYKSFIQKPSNLHSWFKKKPQLAKQARDQVRAAGDVPLEWHVAEPEFIVALKTLFRQEGITGIRFVHTRALK